MAAAIDAACVPYGWTDYSMVLKFEGRSRHEIGNQLMSSYVSGKQTEKGKSALRRSQ